MIAGIIIIIRASPGLLTEEIQSIIQEVNAYKAVISPCNVPGGKDKQ